jgi:hypothetical protein
MFYKYFENKCPLRLLPLAGSVCFGLIGFVDNYSFSSIKNYENRVATACIAGFTFTRYPALFFPYIIFKN